MPKLTLKDCDLKNRRVLMRADFNVPQDENGRISDETRIVETLPTVNHILAQGGRLVLLSHLGRPKDCRDPKYTLRPVAECLSRHLGFTVPLVDDLLSSEAERAVQQLEPGRVLLLENVRFYPGETKNDPQLSKAMARLGDIFVNDAFGSSHRAHCSVTGIAGHLPAAAGFLLQKEIEVFDRILKNPERPFVAILGGAKVADKILVIDNLLNLADAVLIGGGMAYTFLHAQGIGIGKSMLDKENIETATRALAKAKERGVRLLLPSDHVCVEKIDKLVVPTQHAGAVPEGKIAVDIGPETRRTYSEVIKGAGTVVWNGPMGIFEMEPFSHGTRAICEAMASSKAITVIGGGDSAAAAAQLGYEQRMTHISTGGGASLELLEGQVLPGIAALTDKK